MTAFSSEDRPRARDDGLLSERVDDDLVIYDEKSQVAHSLSSDAASVWDRLDGRSSQSEIASKLQIASGTVERAVAELREAGLLAGENGHTRRAFGKRAAAVGGAAVAAPLLFSAPVMAAPTTCSKSALCDPTVTSNDWNDPNNTGDFVLFTAVIHIVGNTPATITLGPGSTITPFGLPAIEVPSATVTTQTGITDATASATYDSGTNSWNVIAPVGGHYIFLTAVAVGHDAGSPDPLVTEGWKQFDAAFNGHKQLDWYFPLHGTVGAVADFAWRSNAWTTSPIAWPGYNGLQVTPSSSSQAAAGVPQYQNRVDGGSNGSMTSNGNCTFTC